MKCVAGGKEGESREDKGTNWRGRTGSSRCIVWLAPCCIDRQYCVLKREGDTRWHLAFERALKVTLDEEAINESRDRIETIAYGTVGFRLPLLVLCPARETPRLDRQTETRTSTDESIPPLAFHVGLEKAWTDIDMVSCCAVAFEPFIVVK